MANRTPSNHHRLIIYQRLARQRRTLPLLMMLFAVLMFALGWLWDRGLLNTGNPELLAQLWERRSYVLMLVGASAVIYFLFVLSARDSTVTVRRRALRVRIGLMPLDISYGRINQIRLVNIGNQYPPSRLSRKEQKLLAPLAKHSATAIDLRTWPKPPIRRLWHRLMFTPDQEGLLLIVKDPMVLNQQIDGAMAARQARLNPSRGYKDPIERAFATQKDWRV